MKKIIALLLAALLGFAMVACEQEGPMERAGEEMDEAVEDAGDRMEEAGEEIEDSMERRD